MANTKTSKTVLVTGATGYIGGRLVPELLEAGYKVKCLVRNPGKVEDLPWAKDVETVKGDLGKIDDVRAAMEGVQAAYFLVHSMSASTKGKFQERDVKIAKQFADAAAAAKVEQIIYLGGLGNDSDPNLSPHLKSRHQVGETLDKGTVPVTEFRAAVIIGSGSASFEMLRHITEKLPFMITPKWLDTKCQPIGISDVLFYLVNALKIEGNKDQVLEIGGPQVMRYRDMIQTYASHAQLRKRIIVTVPLLTPKLSSHWIGLVTPLPTALAAPLVLGLQNETIVTDHAVDKAIPHHCMSFTDSIDQAIKRTREMQVTTSWADADLSWRSPADPMPTDPEWSGGIVFTNEKQGTTTASSHNVYRAVTGIGGNRGWLVTDFLWSIRGVIDKLFGGVGMRRGRRDPNNLRVGDALDFWRVEALKTDTLVRLRAEMRLPGKAWLEWTITDDGKERTLRQLARYQPRGLAGRLYWYPLVPFHAVIFKGLVMALIKEAEEFENPSTEEPSSKKLTKIAKGLRNRVPING